MFLYLWLCCEHGFAHIMLTCFNCFAFFLIILTLSDLLFTLSWALFNEIRILIIHWKVRWVDVLAALNNLSPKKWPFFLHKVLGFSQFFFGEEYVYQAWNYFFHLFLFEWLSSDWLYLCSFMVFSLHFRFNCFQFQFAVSSMTIVRLVIFVFFSGF